MSGVGHQWQTAGSSRFVFLKSQSSPRAAQDWTKPYPRSTVPIRAVLAPWDGYRAPHRAGASQWDRRTLSHSPMPAEPARPLRPPHANSFAASTTHKAAKCAAHAHHLPVRPEPKNQSGAAYWDHKVGRQFGTFSPPPVNLSLAINTIAGARKAAITSQWIGLHPLASAPRSGHITVWLSSISTTPR